MNNQPRQENKKIALVMREFSVNVGGAEKFAVNLAAGLIDRGMNVEVWGGSLGQSLAGKARFRKISFMKKPSFLKVWSFCKGYRRLLRSEEDVITLGLTQVYPVDVYRVGSGIYPHWLSIQYPNPFLRFLYSLIRLVYWSNRIIEKKVLMHPRLKKVVVNSEMEKENLLQYYRISEEKVEVIYNGVDLERFHPQVKSHRQLVRKELDTSSDEYVIIFPSNNFKRKGLATLLRAVSEMEKKDVVVWVAGKGREASFRSLSQRLRIGGQVRFLGKRSDMEKLYAAADLMVLPTQYDSFSNVVLEALACDVPVITTRNNGAAEAIEAGVNGYILEDTRDPVELAGLIQGVIRQRGAWKGQARKKAETFTLETCVNRYADLFQKLS